MTKASLVSALKVARDFIAASDNSTGCCMCGSWCDSHSMGDGHSPVDEGSYHAMLVIQQIDEALNEQATDT